MLTASRLAEVAEWIDARCGDAEVMYAACAPDPNTGRTVAHIVLWGSDAFDALSGEGAIASAATPNVCTLDIYGVQVSARRSPEVFLG